MVIVSIGVRGVGEGPLEIRRKIKIPKQLIMIIVIIIITIDEPGERQIYFGKHQNLNNGPSNYRISHNNILKSVSFYNGKSIQDL